MHGDVALSFSDLMIFLSSLREPEGAAHIPNTWELLLGMVILLIAGDSSEICSGKCLLAGCIPTF